MNEESIKKIIEKGTWYHTVSYKNTKTKGTFDYTSLVQDLNFPSMKGLNILDVGCSDGFFSKYFLEFFKIFSRTFQIFSNHWYPKPTKNP